MTDLLCRWINQELDTGISNDTFAEECANGYLFGMILNKHGLQDDFKNFSKGRSSEAKLNNFTRLEPTLHLLEIPFDSNKAHEVMVGRRSSATQLMYQIFIAVSRKKQHHLTGQTLESMRPSGRVKLEKVQTDFYHQRIKQHTPRQVDLEFQKLINKYQDLHKRRLDKMAQEDRAEEQRIAREKKKACMEAYEKSHQARQNYFKKLKPLSGPPGTQNRHIEPVRDVTREEQIAAENRELKRRKVAVDTMAGIDEFEATHNLASFTTEPERLTTARHSPTSTQAQMMDYLQEIKQRAAENTASRMVRERRRRKILVDQLTALQEQEEAVRERMLVERLMRQCLQERRIATQLMHIRKEKEILRNNRIERQKQFQEERVREFDAALQRIAAESRLEAEEQRMKQKAAADLRRNSLLEKAQQKYQIHYKLCMSVLEQVVELSCKMAEYRELTQGLIPAKFVRDWKLLFLNGQPLYEVTEEMENKSGEHLNRVNANSLESAELNVVNPSDILDEADLNDYLSAVKEWTPADQLCDELPPTINPILSHIVYRLMDIVHPPKPPPSPPTFPRFILRAAFIGLPLTGKTTSLDRMVNLLGVHRIVVEDLIVAAIDAYNEEACLNESESSTSLHSGDGEKEVEPTLAVAVGITEANSTETQHNNSDMGKVPQESPSVELSPLAVLGQQAASTISNGDSVDDVTMSELVVHEIRTLPDGSCWVLDGYPTTVEQAQLLAEKLTGQASNVVKEKSDHAMQLTQNFRLIYDREIKDEMLQKLHSVCGLDLVVWFSASSDTVFQRSATVNTDGALGSEKTDQIQQRMLACDDNLCKLKTWYQQFRTLANVNADQDIDGVCDAVEQLFQGIYDKVLNMEKMKKHGINVNPDKSQGAGLESSSLVMKPNQSKAVKPVPGSVSMPGLKNKRPSSAGFTKVRKLREMKGTQSSMDKHVPSAESELLQLATIPPDTKPGSDTWQYSSLPLNSRLAVSLSDKWPAIEQTYLVTIRKVACLLRQEREAVCRYIYSRRSEFKQYLCRPDHKQEFLSQWQQQYNDIPSLQRREDIMKAELHHRVNDLCDKLWDISDHRKNEAERERAIIMADRWVEDHVGILSNHYVTLMQCELDRYQDTVLLLKDYYVAMESAIPSQLPDTLRLPIIQIPDTAPQDQSASAASSQHSIASSTKGEEGGGGGGDSEAIKSDKNPAPSTTPKRVPLLPRQAPMMEPEEKEKGKKKGASMDPLPPMEDLTGLNLDDQLIVHVYNLATHAVFTLNGSEVRIIKNASAEDNKHPDPPEPVKEEKPAKGKKAKSPPAKKGKATPTKKGKGGGAPEAVEPPPGPPPPSAAEIARRQKLEHMRREHLAALELEERTVKARLELIKNKAIQLIKQLKDDLSITHTEMEGWISTRYQQEVDSVTKMAEVLRQAIEDEEKLLYKLVLSGAQFQINEGITTFTPAPPSPPPLPYEPTHPIQFTTTQLTSLHGHLQYAAPNGFILISSLVDLLFALSNRTYGDGTMPLEWIGLSKQQVTQVCSKLYGSDVEFVDWRRLLLCLLHPLPHPSSADLVKALQEFKAVSPAHSVVGREEYGRVSLEFLNNLKDKSEAKRIKQIIFDLLQDETNEEMDYESMLLYMSASIDPLEGLFKALSVVTGTPLSPPPPSPPSDILITQEALCKVFTHSVYSGLEATQAMLMEVYQTITSDGDECVPLSRVLQQPTVLQILGSCNQYTIPESGLLVTPSTTSLGT